MPKTIVIGPDGTLPWAIDQIDVKPDYWSDTSYFGYRTRRPSVLPVHTCYDWNRL